MLISVWWRIHRFNEYSSAFVLLQDFASSCLLISALMSGDPLYRPWSLGIFDFQIEDFLNELLVSLIVPTRSLPLTLARKHLVKVFLEVLQLVYDRRRPYLSHCLRVIPCVILSSKCLCFRLVAFAVLDLPSVYWSRLWHNLLRAGMLVDWDRLALSWINLLWHIFQLLLTRLINLARCFIMFMTLVKYSFLVLREGELVLWTLSIIFPMIRLVPSAALDEVSMNALDLSFSQFFSC